MNKHHTTLMPQHKTRVMNLLAVLGVGLAYSDRSWRSVK